MSYTFSHVGLCRYLSMVELCAVSHNIEIDVPSQFCDPISSAILELLAVTGITRESKRERERDRDRSTRSRVCV